MNLVPPVTGTPITYEEINQFLGVALAMELFILVPMAVIWIVSMERKAAREQRERNQPTERQEK